MTKTNQPKSRMEECIDELMDKLTNDPMSSVRSIMISLLDTYDRETEIKPSAHYAGRTIFGTSVEDPCDDVLAAQSVARAKWKGEK